MSSDNIIEILSVTDTRTWEEGPDDKWYPVPGSGTENECARCGKLHVIHARVKLGDGSVAIVGTTCADRGSLLFTQLRSAASRAKRRAKVEAQLAKAVAEAKRYDEADDSMRAMPRPPVEEHRDVVLGGYVGPLRPYDRYEVRMGDAKLWALFSEGLTEERRRVLDHAWQRARLAELGIPYSGYHYHDRVKELRKQLKRLA